MPRSKTGVKRTPVCKEDLERAVEAVIKKEKTAYAAAKEFNVDKATLLRHIKKFQASDLPRFEYKKNNDTNKVFTVEEETLLVNYILKASHLNYGMTLKSLRSLAYQFARENGKKYDTSWDANKMAGKEWLRTFRSRHQRLMSLRKPEATSLARSTAFNKANVAIVFANFKKALEKNPGITPFQIWNCDETGISTVHVPPKILATKGLKQVGSMTSGERGTNVTMIAAVNAGGGFMPPMLIFPRKNFKDHMLRGAPPGSIGGAAPSGWSNEDLFYEFLKHFIKCSGASPTNKMILLMDNHESHISVKTIQLAKDNGVTLVTFHPHTSHKMQPLDRGVFGPFKAYYNTAMNNWMSIPKNVAQPATIYDVAELVGRSFPLAFTPNNIMTGFRKSGLYPLNEDIFPDHEFLSANVTDRPMNEVVIETVLVPNNEHPEQNRQIGNSESSPSTSLTHRPVIVSPEEIRPYPKALPRKEIRKGRPKGKSLILTDTPEKERIESQKLAKSLIEAQKLAKKSLKGSKKVAKIKPIKKKLIYVSSSESDVDEPEGLCEDEGLSEEDFADLEDPDNVKIDVGCFVLVKITSKKVLKYFAAEVISVSGEFYEVKYLKKDVNSQKFTREDPQSYELEKSDVVFKLPHPVLSGGSERQLQKLTFGVDLADYNVG